MSVLYLDIFSGISGDMFISALIDLGVDSHKLEHQLERLKLEGYHLHVSRQERGGIAGTKFDVHTEDHDPHHHHHDDDEHDHDHDHEHDDAHGHHHHGHEHHHHQAEHAHHQGHKHEHQHEEHGHGHEHEHEHEHGRTFTEIRQIISKSDLSPWVKEKSIAVFQRIANAEGKIHGHPPERVHFHEVGAIDSIVDIVGSCIALEELGRPRVLAGPVVEGTGTIHCAHGTFPLPAPATLEILTARHVPIAQITEPHELITPTGAALLAEFAESFAPMQQLIPIKTGYGLGTRENKTRPNVLRAILGQAGSTGQTHDWETDTISVLETNIDDLSPEILGATVERALAAGALDVFHTPIQMKKNRPGVLLTILCGAADADRFTELLLTETSAFGVRRSNADRRKLKREVVSVQTPMGHVTVKLGRLDGRVVQVAPEHESCRALAERVNVPIKQVYEAAMRAVQI
jgi:uncharacterized protein (TIGR00299 family) protein